MIKANSERNWTFKVEAVAKNLPANAEVAREVGLIPGSGRSLGVGNGNLLQYSSWDNPMDYSPPSSSVHGILQVRILEWIATPFSKGSS